VIRARATHAVLGDACVGGLVGCLPHAGYDFQPPLTQLLDRALTLLPPPHILPRACPQTDKRVVLTISSKVATFSQASTQALLSRMNSPADPTDPPPSGGLCQSQVFAAMCSKTLRGWSITGGCNTVSERCSPPELSDDSCVSKNATAGAFVSARARPSGKGMQAAAMDDGQLDATDPAERVTPDTPPPRPQAPKQAQFVGCCVTDKAVKGAYGRKTCKRIRVGSKWTADGSAADGGGTGANGRRLLTHPVMNPYKQMRNCRCFNIREYVKMDM
jgi:hypothetical protein